MKPLAVLAITQDSFSLDNPLDSYMGSSTGKKCNGVLLSSYFPRFLAADTVNINNTGRKLIYYCFRIGLFMK